MLTLIKGGGKQGLYNKSASKWFHWKGLGEQGYFYPRMLLIWIKMLYHMFCHKFKRIGNKHLIFSSRIGAKPSSKSVCSQVAYLHGAASLNVFLIIIVYMAHCGRLNNMAVISLQASHFLNCEYRGLEPNPDQWDLSAGKSSQMRSLENESPAVSQERNFSRQLGTLSLSSWLWSSPFPQRAPTRLRNGQLFASLPKSLPTIESPEGFARIVCNTDKAVTEDMWWKPNNTISTRYICWCCLVAEGNLSVIFRIPKAHSISEHL